VYVSSHGLGRESGNGIVSVIPTRSFDTHVKTNPTGHTSGADADTSGRTYVSLERKTNRDRTKARANITIRTVLRFIKFT
jgi:hypothetical protein